MTFETGDGAVPGRYVVSISKVVIETDQPSNSDDGISANVTRHVYLPEKYDDPRKSGLSAEVTEQGRPNRDDRTGTDRTGTE